MTSLYACDYVWLLMHAIRCVCVWNFKIKFFQGGKNVIPEKNSVFVKNGKKVIPIENLEFF